MRNVMLALTAAILFVVVAPGHTPGMTSAVLAASAQQPPAEPQSQSPPPDQAAPPAAQPAQPAQPAQREQIDIHVNQQPAGAIWYRSPLWIAIGAMALLLFAVVVIMMARGGPGETIIRS